MKRTADLNQILLPVAQVETQAYLNNLVQVADVIDWILAQVGKAKVFLSSFSISEEFVRRLYFVTRDRDVDFTLLLDYKATNKTVSLWPFISQVISKTYLADNHSKVLLVQPEVGQNIAVITSQNLTRGNRHEATVVTTNQNVFLPLLEAFQDIITNNSIPLDDLLGRTITDD